MCRLRSPRIHPCIRRYHSAFRSTTRLFTLRRRFSGRLGSAHASDSENNKAMRIHSMDLRNWLAALITATWEFVLWVIAGGAAPQTAKKTDPRRCASMPRTFEYMDADRRGSDLALVKRAAADLPGNNCRSRHDDVAAYAHLQPRSTRSWSPSRLPPTCRIPEQQVASTFERTLVFFFVIQS